MHAIDMGYFSFSVAVSLNDFNLAMLILFLKVADLKLLSLVRITCTIHFWVRAHSIRLGLYFSWTFVFLFLSSLIFCSALHVMSCFNCFNIHRKENVTKFHLLLTTFETIIKDIKILSKISWKVRTVQYSRAEHSIV